MPGLGTPLTEDEIKDFLVNSRLNIHIGTFDDKSDPIIHPTWSCLIRRAPGFTLILLKIL